MDGYEVCRQIRRRPWGETVLIVAMIGFGTVEDRRKSKGAGFDAHLVKPIDHAALTELLGGDGPETEPEPLASASEA